jgi:hypothetical protein
MQVEQEHSLRANIPSENLKVLRMERNEFLVYVEPGPDSELECRVVATGQMVLFDAAPVF